MTRWFGFLLSGLVGTAAMGCGRDSDQVNCDDLLPASQTSYAAVALLITDTNDNRNCADCHNGSEPLYGLNLETPDAAFFTLHDRFDRIYAQIASHDMPPEHEDEKDRAAWSDDDVRMLRSWYCRGAFND